MPAQASHFLRLPVELRLIIYEYIFDDPGQALLQHPLTYVSDKISEEALPILLRYFSGFFWTAIPCDEEWYLAIQPRSKIWRIRLRNVSELPLDTVPTLQTTTSFHLLVGRRISTRDALLERLQKGYRIQLLTHGCRFQLQTYDQQDGVKRLVEDPSNRTHVFDSSVMWFKRGRAGDPEMNKKLIKRVWHQQWRGGGRRGPVAAWMCRVELDLVDETQHAS
jgi:hypothetical protein